LSGLCGFEGGAVQVTVYRLFTWRFWYGARSQIPAMPVEFLTPLGTLDI
jgi:hypothetical protein